MRRIADWYRPNCDLEDRSRLRVMAVCRNALKTLVLEGIMLCVC